MVTVVETSGVVAVMAPSRASAASTVRSDFDTASGSAWAASNASHLADATGGANGRLRLAARGGLGGGWAAAW